MNYLTAINWISIIAFYLGIALFFHKHKKEVVRQWYVFFMYRTQRGIKFIQKLATNFRRFWVVYGYVAIPVVFVAMIWMLWTLISALVNIIIHPETAAPVAGFILPGVSTGVHGPIITVSIWYFLIAVLVTLIVHEGAHAVVAVAHKLKLLSTGVGLFAIIPFAFVEPDEKQIEKAPAKHQLSIFAAGPFTNFVVAAIIVCTIFCCVLAPIANNTQINGLTIVSLDEAKPAGLSELKPGDIITKVDETSFTNIQPARRIPLAPYYTQALGMPDNRLNSLLTTPGQVVNIETQDGKKVTLTAADNNGKGVLGLKELTYNVKPKPGVSDSKIYFLGIIYSILAWVAIFNLGIGLFNTLPIGPVDGGRMAKTAISAIFKKRGEKVFSILSAATLFILVLGIFGAYLIKLL